MTYVSRDTLKPGPVEVAGFDRESDGAEGPTTPAPGGHGHGGGAAGGTMNELLAQFHAFELAEEAKIPEGMDGHEIDSGTGVEPEAGNIDEIADGSEGSPATAGESRYESAGGEPALEVQGHAPEIGDFGGENYEVVFGNDDRVQVGNTTTYPWRTICKLEITAADGARFGCSGAMIGPRTVLTNGHCVFMHDHGGWVRNIRVIPGKNGASEPFGSAVSTFYHSVKGWTESQSSNYDYAVVVLPSNAKLGNTTGWMGLANLSFTSLLGLRVNNSGYPGDKPSGTQWWNANNVLAVTDRRLFYRLDTFGGQSGSPVWRFRDGQRHIVAVHNTGGPVFNGSVRLVKPVFDNLVGWKNQYT
ncbi:MAG: serine protease [Rhodovulum sp.]|nr:serine protease [Rhodovulum sp.]